MKGGYSASGNHLALILAPFGEAQLARLRRRLDVNYESWMETRELRDPEELGARIHDDGCDILVVEVDFLAEEVFEAAPGLGLVGVCRATTSPSPGGHHPPRRASGQHPSVATPRPSPSMPWD